MANLRAIWKRIKSVESTSQITKSMKMVAAAKLRKTQSVYGSLQDYAERCGAVLAEASSDGSQKENPYLTPRPQCRKICYVLIVGNRGLCGTYNNTLLRYGEKLIRDSKCDSYLIVCGRWGKDQIAAAGLHADETCELSDTPSHEEAVQLAEKLKQLYQDGKADRIVMVYQKFRSVLSQTPCDLQLLPLEHRTESDSQREIIFEPDRDSLIDMLLNMYINNTVHAVILEARIGEHAARMTAMTAAADNTEKLMDELTLEFNYARQTAVTTEISEIAGGAEALRNNTAGGY